MELPFDNKNEKKGFSFCIVLTYSYLCRQINRIPRKMKSKRIIFIGFALLLFASVSRAEDDKPSIEPYMVFINEDGAEETGTSASGSAPLTAHLYANAKNTSGWVSNYEWRFTLTDLQGRESETPYLVRYEEDTEYTFTKAGNHKIVCYATFINGNDTVRYTEEYWAEKGPLTVSISESRLEMPNAFSPNDDGINDIYQAKGTKDGNGPKSIVSFEAHIFNRWGQKLYSWTDCYTYEAGWDGTYNGKPVKQGVYFCLVKAKGADGRKYNIRTDVNVLRGYTEDTGVNSTE